MTGLGAGFNPYQKGKTVKVHLRMSDADRKEYGGDEWVVFDTSQLADLGYDALAELEKPLRGDDTSITRIIGTEFIELNSALGFRGMVWLGRQLSGLKKPAWPGFKPNPYAPGVTFRIDMGGDADPPAGGSSEPPSEETTPARKTRSKKG